MPQYELKIKQIQEIPGYPTVDVPQYLIQRCGLVGDRCVINLVANPSRKSHRKMPTPGVKWRDGLIDINDTQCVHPFQRDVNRHGYIVISLEEA